MQVEMKLICTGRSQGVPCKHQGNHEPMEEVAGCFPGCFGCQFFVIKDVKKGDPEWLSQALNEGDGVYRP
jgi:hypothetical protein